MIGDRLRDAINEQIKSELESYYIYLSMVAYFHSQSLDGMAHWMRCQAHEEMIHAMKFYDHIIERGATVTLLDLKQLKTQWSSPLDAWKDAADHERLITSKVNDLLTVCREEKEYASEPILSWFIKEQVEEEANADKNVSQMEMVGDQEGGIFMLDREMGTRVFPVGSPLNPADYSAEK